MSVLAAILTGLVMGAVFGLALEKSRVFEPGVIIGQMQLRNYLMLKIFLTAVATGLVVLAALNGAGLATLHPKTTMYAADALGGALLGVGITLAGACPGTVAAQIGAGYRDAWFTLVGGLAGAVAFTYAEPVLRPGTADGIGRAHAGPACRRAVLATCARLRGGADCWPRGSRTLALLARRDRSRGRWATAATLTRRAGPAGLAALRDRPCSLPRLPISKVQWSPCGVCGWRTSLWVRYSLT